MGNIAEHLRKTSDTFSQRATATLRRGCCLSHERRDRGEYVVYEKQLTKVHSMLENLSSRQKL